MMYDFSGSNFFFVHTMIYHPRRPIGMVENFRRAAFCRVFISYRSLVSENNGFHLEGLDEVEQSIVICQW